MYTAAGATREQALKAAAAAQRAMERHVCSKSQFKFKCFSCGEMINRGDKITKCTAAQNDGMRLRFRGADCRNGLKDSETAFYLGETGTRTWVHVGCIPCYWDSLPEDCNEYSPPALRPVYTDWEAKITHEFEEWRSFTNHYNIEEFLEIHGYPQEKWMTDRIICAVTRFQALWRGCIQKKAWKANLRGLAQVVVGESYEILMDRGKSNEAVYSAEVIRVDTGIYAPQWVSVKFHYDGEVRHYRQKRFWKLVEECNKFKGKMGIEATIIGKISTRRRYKGRNYM